MVSGKELTLISGSGPGRSTGTMGEAPFALFPRGTPREVTGLQKHCWAKRPSVASRDSPKLRLARWKVEVGSFVPETWRVDGTARGPDGGTQGHPAAAHEVQRLWAQCNRGRHSGHWADVGTGRPS